MLRHLCRYPRAPRQPNRCHIQPTTSCITSVSAGSSGLTLSRNLAAAPPHQLQHRPRQATSSSCTTRRALSTPKQSSAATYSSPSLVMVVVASTLPPTLRFVLRGGAAVNNGAESLRGPHTTNCGYSASKQHSCLLKRARHAPTPTKQPTKQP